MQVLSAIPRSLTEKIQKERYHQISITASANQVRRLLLALPFHLPDDHPVGRKGVFFQILQKELLSMERILPAPLTSVNCAASEAGFSSPKNSIQELIFNCDSASYDAIILSGNSLREQTVVPYGLPPSYKKLFPAKKSPLVFWLVTTFPSKKQA
ncbi:MAG: hypothetical protein ACLU9T_18025 [Blautia faecis]